jgi:hypothetical protein
LQTQGGGLGGTVVLQTQPPFTLDAHPDRSQRATSASAAAWRSLISSSGAIHPPIPTHCVVSRRGWRPFAVSWRPVRTSCPPARPATTITKATLPQSESSTRSTRPVSTSSTLYWPNGARGATSKECNCTDDPRANIRATQRRKTAGPANLSDAENGPSLEWSDRAREHFRTEHEGIGGVESRFCSVMRIAKFIGCELEAQSDQILANT